MTAPARPARHTTWNGVEQVPGCSKFHCPQAINAGIDLVMVPDDWKAFIPATIEDVRAGRIPMSRIDDAVSRIIRVKLKSGLFDASPATGPHPDASVIDSPAVRDLAREAAQHLVRGVDHEPIPHDVLRLGGEGFHRKIRGLGRCSKVFDNNRFVVSRSTRNRFGGPREVAGRIVNEGLKKSAVILGGTALQDSTLGGGREEHPAAERGGTLPARAVMMVA